VEGRRRAQNFARLLYINNQKFKVTGPKEGGGKGSIKKNYNCKARPLPRGALMTCPKTKTSHIKPAMLLCVCARTHARERERGEREREREEREERERERREALLRPPPWPEPWPTRSQRPSCPWGPHP
jgi:hypothetical protein